MHDWLNDPRVAIWSGDPNSDYPSIPPFHPSERYPEYPFGLDHVSDSPNPAYLGVRESLRLLGLDTERFGTQAWNPLGALIRSGDHVVLKPNMIRGPARGETSYDAVVTHGSVIRAVLDFVLIALRGSGRITIADGPQTDSDFNAIEASCGLGAVARFCSATGTPVTLLDLRRDRWLQEGDVIYDRVQLPGDPAGYATVELGDQSSFRDYRLNGHLYGADYDLAETATFHRNGRHAYILCRTPLDADVLINLPKLKTHKKTGVTLSMKNMVGINGYRNCLPHHTMGTPSSRGDEFNKDSLSGRFQSHSLVAFKTLLTARGGKGGRWARLLKQGGRLAFGDTNEVVRSGNWSGNDTAWRMVLDLNKALLYFNGEAARRTKPIRYMTIVDGHVGGEGNGPMYPDPVKLGVLVAGFNPVAVDTVATQLIGFDPARIPVLSRAWTEKSLPLVGFESREIVRFSNDHGLSDSNGREQPSPKKHFKAHFGWTNHLEGSPL